MQIDYKTQNTAQKYALMSQSIIPRPIAWIVTEDRDGVINIAPFSYFTPLSSQPPTLIVSIGHKSDGTPKDTLRNIRETKKCTLCLVDEKNLKMMHLSSKALAYKISEAEYFNIPVKKTLKEFPPMIEGITSAFFCTLYREVDLKKSKTIPLILEIKEQFIEDSRVDEKDNGVFVSFKPVGRIGKKYAFLGEEIEPPTIP